MSKAGSPNMPALAKETLQTAHAWLDFHLRLFGALDRNAGEDLWAEPPKANLRQSVLPEEAPE